MRGNARTQGEQRRKEKDNVFGQGTRTPIAISILVKDNSDKHKIFYHDIGDYLSRQQKLKMIQKCGSINSMDWDKIVPDDNHDWLNQRDPQYQKFTTIVGEDHSPFLNSAVGINTARDFWVSGFSKKKVLDNVQKMINTYNAELKKNGGQGKKSQMRDDKKIKWSRGLDNQFKKGTKLVFNPQRLKLEMYRPFTKKWLMYDRDIIEMPGQYYTHWGKSNKVIYTTGKGIAKPFSALVFNHIPNFHAMDTGQGFMRYNNTQNNELLPDSNDINSNFINILGLSPDETFAYIYMHY